jgi:hypothetical protein
MARNQSLTMIIKTILELKLGYYEIQARPIFMFSVDADVKHGFTL